jgi:hypothetical protein
MLIFSIQVGAAEKVRFKDALEALPVPDAIDETPAIPDVPDLEGTTPGLSDEPGEPAVSPRASSPLLRSRPTSPELRALAPLLQSRPDSPECSATEPGATITELSAPTPEQASSPRNHRLPPPPRNPDLSSYESALKKAKQYGIVALEQSQDFPEDYERFTDALQSIKRQLQQYKKSDGAKNLNKIADALLKQAKEIKENRKKTIQLLHTRHKSGFDPKGSQESNVFAWILGTATVATVATVIWYFCINPWWQQRVNKGIV